MVRSWLLRFGALSLAFVGCAQVLGFESDYSLDARVGGAGGVAGAGGSGGAGGGVCPHATWPAPPTASDPGPDDIEFVVVARRPNFGHDDLSNGPTIGYDLDNSCTCQGEGPTCVTRGMDPGGPCDGPSGRDSGIAVLFDALSAYPLGFTNEGLAAGVAKGEWSMLFRVSDYNGKANDEQVSVAFYPTYKLDEEPCQPEGPRWDGSDRWPIPNTALEYLGAGGSGASGGAGGAGGVGGGGGAGGEFCPPDVAGYDVNTPKFADADAYVSDGVLVAGFDRADFTFVISGGETATISVVKAVVTGHVVEEFGEWHLNDAVFASRWSLQALFNVIAGITFMSERICTDNPLYQLVKQRVCAAVDIAVSDDDPTAPCDALSSGVGFDGVPAQLGRILLAAESTTVCDPDLDPALDSCD